MVQQNKQGGGGGRQINVDTARVARAEVTRMNVAGSTKDTSDELLSEIKDDASGSIKDHLDKIRQAVVDCCSQDPAKVAKGNADLSKNVGGLNGTLGKNTGAMTSMDGTLEKLNKNIEVLITTMSTGGGTGGEGGGGGGAGPDLAKVRATEKQIEIIGDAFVRFEREMDGANKSVIKFKTGWEESTSGADTFTKAMLRMANDTILTETTNAFNSLVESVQDVVAGMADLRAATRQTFEVLKQGVDTTRQGVVTAGEFFLDDWNQLWEGAGAILTGDFHKLGDSIKNTLTALEAAREDEGLGISSVLINQTDSIDELGGYMKDARTAMFEGNSLRRMMKDEEANAALIESLSLQRRAGIMGEISASELGRRAEQRANTLGIIAANTGMTVEQLMKAGKEEAKSFEMLHAMNLINDKQLDNLTNIAKMSPELGDIMAKAAEARFDEVTFYRMFPELREMIVKGDAQGQFREFLRATREGSAADDVREAYKEIIGAVKPFSEQMMTRATELGANIFTQQREVTALTVAMRKLPAEMKKSVLPDQLASTWNSITSFFDNMFPGGSVGLIRALAANTIAVWANTGAQMGLGGKMMRWGGKLLGLGKGLVSGVGKVGGLLSGLAAKLAPLLIFAAKALAGLAAAAGIGIALGLMFNKAYEKISQFLGGAGSLGSDIADLVDEVKYGFTGDADAAGAPSKSMNEMSFTEKMKRYGPNWMDAIPGLNVLGMARRTARIAGDARSMAGPGSPPVPGAPTVNVPPGEGTNVGGVEGRLDRVASAIEEGNRYARETAANTKAKGSTSTATGDVSLVASGAPAG